MPAANAAFPTTKMQELYGKWLGTGNSREQHLAAQQVAVSK